MAKINARNVVIRFGGVQIQDLTNCTLDVKTDMFDTTTKNSNGFREILPGLTSYTMSGDGLVEWSTGANRGLKDIAQAQIGKTLATVSFTTAQTGDWQWSGSGYFTSHNVSGGNEEAFKFSFSLEGTGALTFTQI